MLATDAVFSTRPLALDIGDELGQWEEKQWQDLFIAQPGSIGLRLISRDR